MSGPAIESVTPYSNQQIDPALPPPTRFRVRDREEIAAAGSTQPEAPVEPRATEVQTTLF